MRKNDQRAGTINRYGTRGLLLVSGLVAMGIATMILFAAETFYAGYGIALHSDADLANELKAPAGTLLLAGLLMLVGAIRPKFTVMSLTAATAVYLSYGLSRCLSMAVDGVPNSELVVAGVFELALGSICSLDLIRHRTNNLKRKLTADRGWLAASEENPA